MMITGQKIKSEIDAGRIEVDPFEEDNIQPSSLDLRLGDKVKVYTQHVGFKAFENSMSKSLSSSLLPYRNEGTYLSLSGGRPTQEFTIDGTGWILNPGVLYLMHTMERLKTEHYATDITGKSSTARIGVQVHLTAGFGDPGFDGQYTLEVSVVHPVILYAGDLICQARFWTLEGPITSYQGRYVGERAKGPHAAAEAHSALDGRIVGTEARKELLVHKACWDLTTAAKEVIPWMIQAPPDARCALCQKSVAGEAVRVPPGYSVSVWVGGQGT